MSKQAQHISEILNTLSSIEQRSRENAAELPSQEELGQFWSGVGFVLGNTRFVAPLKEVSEILDVPEYTKIPGAKNWMRGIANVRGTLLPIMDLRGFLSGKLTPFKKQTRLLVVDYQGGTTGLIVDDIMGLQHFEDEHICDTVRIDDATVTPYVVAGFAKQDQQWAVFSLKTLTENPDFMQVAI